MNDSSRATGIRVLLVEDSDASRRSLTRLLQLNGFEVTAVSDAQSAFDRFEAVPLPEIVLTDLMLPDYDGHHVANRAAELKPRPIVAILTGDFHATETHTPASSAADFIFLKPVNIQDVLAKVLTTYEERFPPKAGQS